MKRYRFMQKDNDGFLKCRYTLTTTKNINQVKTDPLYWYLQLNECMVKETEIKEDK
jgi:hypothetical protein